MCVNRGATTTVTATRGQGRVTVRLNGCPSEAPVTTTVARSMVEAGRTDLDIDTCLGLPASSGFGMSAAGALSTAFALAEILGRPREEAFAAAHRAELANRTGLGDVPALTAGGLTFRRREGLPPFGQIDRLADELELVSAVVGPAMPTSTVLGDPGRRARIEEVGRECYQALCHHPTKADFFRLSREFAYRSGLATPHVKAAVEAVDGLGEASMVMLGNAVFAAGEIEQIEELLTVFGPTYRLSLDTLGPRVLAVEE